MTEQMTRLPRRPSIISRYMEGFLAMTAARDIFTLTIALSLEGRG
jgi:hypothetical protein